MKDIDIYNFIDDLILDFINDIKKNNYSNKIYNVQIGGNTLKIHIWSEFLDDRLIQVFEVRIKKIFDHVYTKGVLIENDSYKILNNEEMWEYGF